MIIWINGAFGAGKTTAAYALHRRLENSFVYDPENVGFFLRKNMPEECRTHDFQDMRLWRGFNYQFLKEIDETYRGTVIVPMTLVRPAYYEEIVRRLADEGVTVLHVILYAKRDTILKRLKKRSLGMLGREAFAVEAIGPCLAFFDRCETGIRIETDCMTVEQIVEEIAERAGLALLPEEKNRLKRGLARWKTAVRHVRL